MSDPLHVEVASALGWTNLHERTGGHWWGREPHGGLTITVPRYDTSWCSVGPLCERYEIGIMWDHGSWIAQHMTKEGHDQYAGGDRPTEAISRLVVHLAKKGLLQI